MSYAEYNYTKTYKLYLILTYLKIVTDPVIVCLPFPGFIT